MEFLGALWGCWKPFCALVGLTYGGRGGRGQYLLGLRSPALEVLAASRAACPCTPRHRQSVRQDPVGWSWQEECLADSGCGFPALAHFSVLLVDSKLL